jgi:HD-GYP domain-containing protein (c-di-GMP phosphodiesterase class II)
VTTIRHHPGRALWFVTAAVVVAVTALTTVGSLAGRTWERPELLFWMVTGTAVVCVVAATLVIAIADRREMAEIGLLGSALTATSVMPLVHGLVTPGVLYDETAAFRTSSYLALPIAVAVVAPLLLPATRFGRWAARRWRDWTLLALLTVFVVASVVVFFPDLVVLPGPRHPVTVVLSAGMLFAVGSLSLRQLRLHELGRRLSNLVASLSIALLAVTALLPTVERPYSAAFWWLHVAGGIGVLGACIGMGVSKRMSTSTRDLLAPVLASDPLVAFELGLSPVVHRFVADLERKDQITRDHVVRTGELAIRVGERLRLPARRLRELGIAAMLHDVGKLRTPDEILTKPSSLTPEEYEVIKQHPLHGEEMLAGEPTLAAAAYIVRSHHERVDGRGYPDGLVGDQIPLPSRIIAVCDAFDAMTHDRQYRPAMSVALAFAILREHAGSQWDAAIVERVIALLPSMPRLGTLDAVGRAAADVSAEVEIPADIEALLATVDAEI